MAKCLGCKSRTTNPKFCSRSCAARHNNAIQPKRVAQSRKCANPGCSDMIVAKSNRYCDLDCSNAARLYRTEIVIVRLINARQPVPENRNYIVKRILIEKHGHCCQVCKRRTWNDEPIPLELDHKDGNSDHWSWRNLRLICPNCHAQTDTYKGRNLGNGRHSRRLRYAQGRSY